MLQNKLKEYEERINSIQNNENFRNKENQDLIKNLNESVKNYKNELKEKESEIQILKEKINNYENNIITNNENNEKINNNDIQEKCIEYQKETSAKDLCSGFPNEFENFVSYTRNLQFTEVPDYNYLKIVIKLLFLPFFIHNINL